MMLASNLCENTEHSTNDCAFYTLDEKRWVNQSILLKFNQIILALKEAEIWTLDLSLNLSHLKH